MSDGCGCDGEVTGEAEHEATVNESARCIDSACAVPEGYDAGAGA